MLSDTCHGKFFQYYERIVVLKHISGNLLLQRVHVSVTIVCVLWTHTQLLQKHAVNRCTYICTYNNIMYSTLTMLDIVL